MHEKLVRRAYLSEMAVAILVYIVLLMAAIRLGRPMPEGVLRTLVLVSPMIGFGLMIRAVTRQVARVDEYQRMRLLENLAMTVAITGAVTFTYGFLETAGFPKLSMFTVWVIIGVAFGGVAFARKLANR